MATPRSAGSKRGPKPSRAMVFTLHPHQNVFNLPASAAVILPNNLPPRRAMLAANMETALNGVWDGRRPRPTASWSSVRVSLVSWSRLVRTLPAPMSRSSIDINRARAEFARAHRCLPSHCRTLPASRLPTSSFTPADAAGLATALERAGQEATIVEMSWYGDVLIAAPFGRAFHSRRLRLISTQVGPDCGDAPAALDASAVGSAKAIASARR